MPRIDPRGFAETVIRVKRKYGLSIDRRERKALEMALAGDTLTVLTDSLEVQADVSTEGEPPSICGTTTGTDGLRVQRPEGTGLLRFPAIIRRTSTCVTETATVGSVSETKSRLPW